MAASGIRRGRPADVAVGALASAGAVALVTAAIAVLDRWIPVLSLGALYVFAVLFVSVGWGLAFALPVAVVSMLAFNWFFLPPTHTLHLRDGENWLVLVLYLVVAIVVSELAGRSRRRAREALQREREAALLAEVAASLLGGRVVTEELETIAARAAGVLGVSHAWIVLGAEATVLPDAVEVPLAVGDRVLGAISMPAPGAADERIVARFLPALASLLAVALEREQLELEALEAETLRRSDAVKTTLLRAVSHDLRSPLTAIAAAAGGLASSELALDERDRAELAETILVESTRLERMVADLLDLSRLEAGAVTPLREIWSVDELVGAALDELRDEGGTVVDVPPDLPPVEVDAAQARRILVNLLENAHRHAATPQGVRVAAAASGEGSIVVRVRDDGPGIAEVDAEAVFEPFWRGSAGPGRTGLGLAIARGFAVANGGALRAEPAERGGSFALELPVAGPHPAEGQP
jgi:two-component system, OmpR family, sensor histidine kinase KdpD